MIEGSATTLRKVVEPSGVATARPAENARMERNMVTVPVVGHRLTISIDGRIPVLTNAHRLQWSQHGIRQAVGRGNKAIHSLRPMDCSVACDGKNTLTTASPSEKTRKANWCMENNTAARLRRAATPPELGRRTVQA